MKRLTALLLCAVLLMSVIFPASAALPEQAGLSQEEWEVLLLTNRERLKEGLDPLTSVPFLQDVCDIRAEEITERFSHTRPDGTKCFTALDEKVHPYYCAGENIAAGHTSPEDVVTGWMDSYGHRMNILDKDFIHMGTGYVYTPWQGYGMYWVQFFFSGFDCAYSDMRLVGNTGVAASCASIDDAQLTLALQCSCGTSYLPLMAEFCTGFVPGQTGTQTVTVSCLGFTKQFKLTVNESGQGEVIPDETVAGFTDVPASAWYAGAVAFAVEHELMNGVGGGKFEPEGTMTRAMLVTVLWREAGSPDAGASGFVDVPDGQWYTTAVAWAREAGVVNGTSDTTFAPEGSITREQLATVLYRYVDRVGYPSGVRGNLSGFPDAGQISDYAADAMAWAVGMGLINGSDGFLLPQGNATRAQVSAILMRYIKNVVGQ